MTINLGPLRLDPAEFGSQGSAVLGIRDSGKTYTATLIAELLFGAGIPFITFDPIGVWRYLRVPGKGKGIPVVVAGGEDPDIPLTPSNAPAIVEAAMQQGVSLIIDLFDMKLSKADWKRIVRDCVQVLLHKNKEFGLRHVFLEEAAEFAPQTVGRGDGEVYAAIEKLARMGGNSRLGYTLISQRSQEVNKAVLELCDNLFLHRQKGLNALANAKKWLDVAGASAGEVMAALPTLPQGECFAWLSGSDVPVHLKVPAKNSLHPDRRVTHSEAATKEAKRKAVNVDSFVEKLRGQLATVDAEMKANDPKLLKADVARLTRELAEAQKGKGPAYPDLRDALATSKTETAEWKRTAGQANVRADALQKKIEAAAKALGVPIPAGPVTAVEIGEGAGRRRAEFAAPAPAPAPRREQPADDDEAGKVPSGCAKPLATLAGVYPGGMTESQWATAAGYKKSGGTWGEYRRRLLRAAMIEQRGEQWYATELGANSAGDVELPPQIGPELARWWSKRIPGTPKMVEVLLESWPHFLSREELAERMDMIASGGSFGEYVRRLKRNNIAVENGAGIRLAEEVMGD